jgi:type II secretory pathway pseudopilin PulG
MRPAVPERERGFGLVEALIAVGIMALMASLTFEVIATNAEVANRVADRRLAAMVAQSAIEEVAANAVRGRDGEDSGMRWHATVEAYSDDAARGGLPLELITVTVARPGAGRPLFELKTLRVRP